MIVTIETYLTVVCKFINNPNTIIPYHRIIALMSAEASVNDMNHIVEMAKLLDKNDILILSMSNKVKHPQNMIYNIYNNIKSQLYVVESDSITETLLIESKLFDIRLLNRIP